MSEALLTRIAQELATIRQLLSKQINAGVEAESEIPEKMRRFVMYMHDIHDIKNLYTEHGHPAPDYVLRELERCDDRFRQLLDEAHNDGGTFEKVRRQMAYDPLNRWDHTRLLPPTEKADESGTSEFERTESAEDGAKIRRR